MTSTTVTKAMLCSTAGAGLALILAGSALAQTDAAAPAGAAKAPALEEIVVTADRKGYGAELVQAGSFRGAKQIDTPLTISVIPNDVLQSQQDLTLLDALQNTAGVSQSQTATSVYSNLSIRGVTVDNRANYRLDGILPIVNLIDLPLEDKDRVEALKGASALYYGFTTPSGVINLTMKRPTATPYLETDAFGNDHGSAGGHIDISDTWGMFGLRINALSAAVDPGIKDTYGHREFISEAFDFKPNDRLTVSVDGELINKKVPEPTAYLLTAPASTVSDVYPTIALPPLLNPSTNLGSYWMKNSATERNLLLTVNYKLSDSWAVTFDAGNSIATRTRNFSTFTPTNLTTGQGTLKVTLQDGSEYVNRNFRGELAGTFYTGPFLHEVLIGASQNLRSQFLPTSVSALCGKSTCTEDLYDPQPIPFTPEPIEGGVLTLIDDIGYYAFDRVKLGDMIQVLGGIRKSDYTESNTTTGQTTYSTQPISGSAGVIFKPRPWVSLYGTYIEGLETTTAAPITAANAGQQLPATTSTQYEGGVKMEPLRGLMLTAAWFDINRGSTYVNGANVYVEDGRARYEGEEFSATGDINRYFSIYSSAMLLDARQVSGAPTIITSSKGVVTVSPSTVGKEIDNAPKVTFSLAGQYHVRDRLPGLSFTAGVYYTGARAINVLDPAFVPGYTLLNLGAAYETTRFSAHPIIFRVNGENVANTRYWSSTGSLYLSEGAPEEVRFSISTRIF